MFDKLKIVIGRKLGSIILGPLLIAGLAIINSFLPESARWSPEQLKTIAEGIIGAIIAFLAAQGTHDVVKGSASAGTIPVPPLPLSIPDKVDGSFASGIHHPNTKR